MANALDAQAVQLAMNKVRPDAVIDELTSLPKHYTPEEMRVAAGRDRTIRLEGGRNLYDAARATSARRYIVQSTGFFYAPGSGLATETEPLAIDASPAVSGSVRTYTQIEQRALSSSDLEAVALRYGFFYGPGTWFSPAGDVANQVRDRKFAIAGSGQGVWSWVHVEDAAGATAAALDCTPGVYNVVDSDPSELSVGFRPLLPSWEHRNHRGSVKQTPSKHRVLIGSTIQRVSGELPMQRQNATFALHQGNSSGWRSRVARNGLECRNSDDS